MAKQKTPTDLIKQWGHDLGVQAEEKYLHAMASIRARCGSPIEEIMAASIYYQVGAWFNSCSEGSSLYWLCMDVTWPDVNGAPFSGVFVYQQAHVGKYRVDFLCMLRKKSGDRFVVIECDGHDFHERTKEQAARDRARDRWMTAQGLTVLRFTGSEIARDPVGVGEQVCEIISAMYERQDEHGEN